MHSSRMSTVRCSSLSDGERVSARGCLLPRGCLPGGCLPRGVCLWGVCLGVSALEEGGSAWGCLPMGCVPPPVDRILDTRL